MFAVSVTRISYPPWTAALRVAVHGAPPEARRPYLAARRPEAGLPLPVQILGAIRAERAATGQLLAMTG